MKCQRTGRGWQETLYSYQLSTLKRSTIFHLKCWRNPILRFHREVCEFFTRRVVAWSLRLTNFSMSPHARLEYENFMRSRTGWQSSAAAVEQVENSKKSLRKIKKFFLLILRRGLDRLTLLPSWHPTPQTKSRLTMNLGGPIDRTWPYHLAALMLQKNEVV